MKKRGILTGLILCLLTACVLSGAAMGTSRAQSPTSGTFPGSTSITWSLSGTKLTIGGGAIPDLTRYVLDPLDPDADPATDFATIWANVRRTVTSVEFGKDVTGIGDYAFYNCPRLTGMSFQIGSPNAAQITTVGNHAFENCVLLEQAPLPASITSIGESAFSGCTRLNSVIISHNVTAIGARAFYASGLTSAFIPNENATVGASAFDNCSKLARVHYCGAYDSWKDQITGGPGGADILIDYNITISENASHQTCNPQRESYWQIKAACTCGQTFDQREPLPRLDHDVETVSADVPATCEEAGHTAGSKCKREDCGLPLKGWTTIAPLGHDFGDPVEGGTSDPAYRAPTCTVSGLMPLYRTCKRTGCTHSESAGAKTLAPLGHKEPANGVTVTVQKAATCSEVGIEVHTFRCTVCRQIVSVDVEIPIDPSKHTPDQGTVTQETAPTCTQNGQKTVEIRCQDCYELLETKTEPIEALGHLPPANPDEKIIKRPSCQPGEKLISYTCTREGCGASVSEEHVPIPANKEHTWIEDPDHPAVPPTCSASGKTARIICSVCKEVKEEQQNIPADLNKHVPGDPEKQEDIKKGYVEIKTEAPTCTEEGSKTTTIFCKLCQEKLSEETETLPAAHTFAENDNGTEQIKVKPTCDRPGVQVTTKHCSVCDKDIELPDSEKPIDALGGDHEFGDWETINTVNGKEYQHRFCKKCGFEGFRFVAPTYTVTLDPKGGTLPDGTGTTLETGEDGKLTAALPEPTRTDYRFDGWYDAETDGKKVDKDTVFTGHTTLYAYWTSTKIPDDGWTVTFDPNGGALAQESDKTAKTGADGKLTKELPTPTLADSSFAGWFDAKEGGKRADKDTVFTGHTTLYAHWTKESAPGEGFTVKLDANEGTLGDSAVTELKTGADGKLAALPEKDPTRSGYTFDGWYDARTGGNKISTDTVFTEDTTIFARWKQGDGTGDGDDDNDDTTYAIRVDSTEHGTLTPSISTAAKGTTVTVYADADSGYKLSSIQATDGSGASVTMTKVNDTRYTFTMPASLVNITGSFARDTSSSSGSGQGSSGSWSTGGTWNTTDTSTAPDPVPVVQSVPQINAYGQAFRDVPQSHWAAGEIAWAAQNSYMNGTGSGVFSPDRPISQQQLWTVLTRLLRYTNVSDTNLQAVRQGLLDGGSPGSPATRQQMVTALYRCAFLLGGARQPSLDIKNYPDSARVAGYAREAMGWAVTNGILTGTADGRLNPTGTVSRAQFAVFLFRFSQRYR